MGFLLFLLTWYTENCISCWYDYIINVRIIYSFISISVIGVVAGVVVLIIISLFATTIYFVRRQRYVYSLGEIKILLFLHTVKYFNLP